MPFVQVKLFFIVRLRITVFVLEAETFYGILGQRILSNELRLRLRQRLRLRLRLRLNILDHVHLNLSLLKYLFDLCNHFLVGELDFKDNFV